MENFNPFLENFTAQGLVKILQNEVDIVDKMHSWFRIVEKFYIFFQIRYRDPLFHLYPSSDMILQFTQMTFDSHFHFRFEHI